MALPRPLPLNHTPLPHTFFARCLALPVRSAFLLFFFPLKKKYKQVSKRNEREQKSSSSFFYFAKNLFILLFHSHTWHIVEIHEHKACLLLIRRSKDRSNWNWTKKQNKFGLDCCWNFFIFLFSLLSPFFSNFTMTLILHGYSIKTIEINQNKKKLRHEKWKVVFRLLNSNLLTNAISNFENENQDNSKLIEHKKTTQNSSSGIEL